MYWLHTEVKVMKYFYKIRNKHTGQYYVGSQYGKNANSKDLWKTYFTSSKLVKEQGYENFEIVSIVEREDARKYEAKYLQRAYSILGKERFCELLLNRNVAPGIINTPEVVAKANEKRKVSNSIAAKKLLAEGKHNFQLNPQVQTKELREARSKRMIGNDYAKYRNMTDELKQTLAEKSKGNTNVRGRIWVINEQGERRRVEKDKIPEGFKRGMTYE